MSEVNEEVGTVANDSIIENQEIDYKAKYEEATKESNRLNSIIQKHKKESKTNTPVESPIGEADVEKMLEEREFYKNNPELAEHKDAISDFTSTGKVSLAQAKRLVLDTNPDIVARQNTQNANFTAGTPDFSKSTYTKKDLESMSQLDYNKVMALKEQGKVSIN